MNGLDPSVWLSLLMGGIFGSLAHLFWGRQWVHLPLFVLTGIVGCLLMWLVGWHVVDLPVLGGLPLVEATVVAWLLLGVVAMLQRA